MISEDRLLLHLKDWDAPETCHVHKTCRGLNTCAFLM